MIRMDYKEGIIQLISGPVVKGINMGAFMLNEMVTVGSKRLIGEVVSIEGDVATVQVYEETEGLKAGEKIISTGNPLSVTLGPGMLGNIFDGIQRPLQKINSISDGFIPEGIGLLSLDEERKWPAHITVKPGDELKPGMVYATVQETLSIVHRLTVPAGTGGKVIEVLPDGDYTIKDTVVVLERKDKSRAELKLSSKWPVRQPRPVAKRLPVYKPLVTGQRVIDSFYPIGKDIIIYVGCGERGNEMTDVLEEFPDLTDPRTGRPLMERVILIANTSNMPVAAREASIYTGITMAEYYRDMGYDVALMADSTSRWAEALREISGRLEEMPAEEGYPAYLPSRLAEFYERAGCVRTLGGQEASVTIIGAVSPPGGDFSEPVTENTKRFVTTFLALDKKLAYSRHYPAINYLTSYSGYITMLRDWYSENVAPDMLELRTKMIRLLQEEEKLNEIVQLVGEDVLPNDQALVMETARIIKKAFLQQNALHKEDTYTVIAKQYKMLKVIDTLYESALRCVKLGIPISTIKSQDIVQEVLRMKESVPNDRSELLDELSDRIVKVYSELSLKYE